MTESESGSVGGADAALAALLWGYCDPAAVDTRNCALGTAPSPTPDETQTPSGAPTASLTDAELEVMSHIPTGIIDTGTCEPTRRRDRAKDATASITCVPGSGASAVWYESFPTRAAVGRVDKFMVGAPSEFDRACPSAPGEGAWAYTARPNVTAGRQACYARDGEAWMVWTDNAKRMVVTAFQQHINWKVFYRWWRSKAGPK